jgi:hypothetical protein
MGFVSRPSDGHNLAQDNPPPQGTERPMDIREYVHQVFLETVPYGQTVESYDASDVPALLEMLNDPREEPYWTNIVIVLNMIGDESVLEPLIEFIEKGVEAADRKLSDDHYRAKTAAIMTMGYLINRTGSERAIEYLIASLDPAIWRTRGTTGSASFQRSEAESRTDFSKYAILGLGLSGHPKAAEILTSLQNPDEAQAMGITANFQLEITDIASEALRANERIARVGLIAYYDDADDDDDEQEDKDDDDDDRAEEDEENE